MTIKAVLFDLDDTLYNRDQAFERFAERFTADYAPALEGDWVSALSEALFELDCHGYKPRREMFTEIINRFSWRVIPGLDELIQYFYVEFPKCVDAGPELVQTLEWCFEHHLQMGIVTNAPVEMQQKKIDKLGIRKYMRTIIISEAVGVKKPDPKIFHLALDSLNVDSQSTLFVGDNPAWDVKGANDAGLISVWLSRGQVWDIDEYKPDLTIERLSDLTTEAIWTMRHT